ncbi:PAS domain-containing hybrid sensor histidine kinase/response regulator [Salipiger abyssi]|uniref:Sensory/regulatory protein RpfC n=1 Tax=Salipiger abyssi TaxID=1250539 RepID=A0A1P8UTN6_9RHOB|nr:PAS domain-containing hybrid sensor histidine kinase/response regulator [Salipiger abyssi]APZ52718.1 PAS/PAC sensor hybrid histidine kinase [Salipiger abyssi]
MSQSPIVENQSLAAFEASNSPAGLLQRYARGRVRYFAHRQIATGVGALALALLVSPLTGMLAAMLVILGEAVDCEVLRRVPAALHRGAPLRRVALVSAVSAGFQALTISATVVLAQYTATDGEASLFSFAFLAAAVLNAGVVRRYHPLATDARIVIYALTALAGFVAEVLVEESGAGLVYNFFGLAMLAFISFVFLRFVDGAERRRAEDSLRLLEGQAALARANRDLRASQAEVRQLALVARHANDSIMLMDPESRVLWVNDGFTRQKGYTAADVVGRLAGDLLAGPDSDLEDLADLSRRVAAGETMRREILNYTADGRKIWVEAAFAPILNARGEVEKVIVTERDITDARLRARELAEAKERAEEGARTKAVFLATMSHEIRTPMNGIIGMTDLLFEGRLTPDQKLYAATIRKSAEALMKIINDILDYSKLEADKFAILAEPFSLAACIRDAAEVLRPQAREKGLFLDICHETPLPDRLCGDSGRVRQILINLLGNAVKFTEAGGVTLTTRAKSDVAGADVTIVVQDSGIGVPEARAERIFEQFEQADAETTRRYGGTGLGLAISRQLAARMGGGLRLLRGEGPGACFELTLRLGKPLGQGPPPCVAAAAVAPGLLAPMRLLLAEDNGTNRLLVRRFLEEQPVEIYEALNGREAVERVRADPPDAVLMDMSMPVLDGLSATRIIRAADLPQPWIVALTANAFDSDRAACLAAGMDDFLGKPLRKSALLAALARAQAGEKPLGPPARDGVSRAPTPAQEPPSWKSPQESGTTSGKSTRSSAR